MTFQYPLVDSGGRGGHFDSNCLNEQKPFRMTELRSHFGMASHWTPTLAARVTENKC